MSNRTIICICTECQKSFLHTLNDGDEAEFQRGIDEGIYYKRKGLWYAESCCISCLEQLKQEVEKVLIWIRRHMPLEEKFLYKED